VTQARGRKRGAGALHARLARAGFTLIELTVVIVIIGVLAALALPNFIKVKDKAKEAETKAGVHKIQTDLERFAVDHTGEYPPYLTGGDNAVLDTYLGDDNTQSLFRYDTPEERAVDPLIRQGYVDGYPSNPFVRNNQAVQDFQASYGDPLRNAMPDARISGSRFGPYGNLMGQCLCDARWLQWTVFNPAANINQPRYTWSNIQYDFYDAWAGSMAKPYLPGSFMYKSMGELVPNVKDRKSRTPTAGIQGVVQPKTALDEITYPMALTNYILGAWGSARTKGQDILGEEPLVIFSFEGGRSSTPVPTITGGDFFPDLRGGGSGDAAGSHVAGEMFTLLGIAPWTRGVNRAHVGPLWGSPYGPSPRSDEQLMDSNPNGPRDGLVIALTGGEPITAR
jgi:prepilin-type N-terminal cleavage/methylation domain-containing protein